MFAHRIASFTLIGGIACGPQLPPAGPEPQPLDLGASLLLSVGGISPGDEARLSASAKFWAGDATPEPGAWPRGQLRRLGSEDRLWVNGTPLELSIADWGPSYAAHLVPEAADGRYTFRLDIGAGTVTRTLSVQRVTLDAPPEGTLRASAPVTVSWRPAFPSAQGVRVGLSSCVLAEPLAVTESSATLSVRLSTPEDHCKSILHVAFLAEEPLGAPFRSGTIYSSTGATKDVLVVP